MWHFPVLMGQPNDHLVAIRGQDEVLTPPGLAMSTAGMGGPSPIPLDGKVLIPRTLATRLDIPFEAVATVPDGNRGAVAAGMTLNYDGQIWLLSFKGCGARTALFEENPPFDGELGSFEQAVFSEDSWFGHSPWGSCGLAGCIEDLEVTARSGPEGIRGAMVCPLIRCQALPANVFDDARGRFTYRRFSSGDAYYQQVRLVPSNVRLYHHSEHALGPGLERVLSAFGVEDMVALDAFICNYVRSSVALLTLLPRTLEPRSDGTLEGLVMEDVWLDKDTVISPDGTVLFVDLEGLATKRFADAKDAARVIKVQYERSYYEFMYGLHRLLGHRKVLAGSVGDRASSRDDAAMFLRLMLAGDPWLRLLEGPGVRVVPVYGDDALGREPALALELELITEGGGN